MKNTTVATVFLLTILSLYSVSAISIETPQPFQNDPYALVGDTVNFTELTVNNTYTVTEQSTTFSDTFIAQNPTKTYTNTSQEGSYTVTDVNTSETASFDILGINKITGRLVNNPDSSYPDRRNVVMFDPQTKQLINGTSVVEGNTVYSLSPSSYPVLVKAVPDDVIDIPEPDDPDDGGGAPAPPSNPRRGGPLATYPSKLVLVTQPQVLDLNLSARQGYDTDISTEYKGNQVNAYTELQEINTSQQATTPFFNIPPSYSLSPNQGIGSLTATRDTTRYDIRVDDSQYAELNADPFNGDFDLDSSKTVRINVTPKTGRAELTLITKNQPWLLALTNDQNSTYIDRGITSKTSSLRVPAGAYTATLFQFENGTVDSRDKTSFLVNREETTRDTLQTNTVTVQGELNFSDETTQTTITSPRLKEPVTTQNTTYTAELPANTSVTLTFTPQQPYTQKTITLNTGVNTTPTTTFSKGYTLEGTVTLPEKVSTTRIRLQNTTYSTTTNGPYSIERIPSGTYTLILQPSGFPQQTTQLTINSDTVYDTTYTLPTYTINGTVPTNSTITTNNKRIQTNNTYNVTVPYGRNTITYTPANTTLTSYTTTRFVQNNQTIQPVYEQKTPYIGTVTDKNNTSLNGTITFLNTTPSTTTQVTNGTFNITIPHKTYKVNVRSPGYQPKTTTIIQNDTVTLIPTKNVTVTPSIPFYLSLNTTPTTVLFINETQTIQIPKQRFKATLQPRTAQKQTQTTTITKSQTTLTPSFNTQPSKTTSITVKNKANQPLPDTTLITRTREYKTHPNGSRTIKTTNQPIITVYKDGYMPERHTIPLQTTTPYEDNVTATKTVILSQTVPLQAEIQTDPSTTVTATHKASGHTSVTTTDVTGNGVLAPLFNGTYLITVTTTTSDTITTQLNATTDTTLQTTPQLTLRI